MKIPRRETLLQYFSSHLLLLTTVEPEEPFPSINHCQSSSCKVFIDRTSTNYSIKCMALRSRPQVTLTLYLDGLLLDVDPQMRVNFDMTYDTLLETLVPLEASRQRFVITCEAVGESFPAAKMSQTLTINRGDLGKCHFLFLFYSSVLRAGGWRGKKHTK